MFKFIVVSGLSLVVLFSLAILFCGVDENTEEACVYGAIISGGVSGFLGLCKGIGIALGIVRPE